MSNSQKGITVKISNWILTKLNVLISFLESLKSKLEVLAQEEDEILTYEQYRSRVQLSGLYITVYPKSTAASKPVRSAKPTTSKNDDDAEEAGCLVLC